MEPFFAVVGIVLVGVFAVKGIASYKQYKKEHKKPNRKQLTKIVSEMQDKELAKDAEKYAQEENLFDKNINLSNKDKTTRTYENKPLTINKDNKDLGR